jgi:hypothetical protein
MGQCREIFAKQLFIVNYISLILDSLKFLEMFKTSVLPWFLHRKKSLSIFLSPAGMSLTKLSLGGNYDVIYKLFPPRESLVSDIPAGDGNIEKLFLRCCSLREKKIYIAAMPIIRDREID